ncbi:phage major capsid protein [Streptomyces noursei]|uniref:phage major capsid protein n=1 Tax=Streptomyces noursei TaxID=1971 RepID=UPI0038128A73
MEHTLNKREMVADLIAKRSALKVDLESLVDVAVAEKRALTDDESARFDKGEADIRAYDERIKELDAQVRADEAAAEMATRYAPRAGDGVQSEPEIYRSGVGGRSFFRDLHLSRNKGDREATDRLARNTRGRAADLEVRAISTSNGAGGEFVPPLWLENEFVRYARPGRITANLAPSFPLPPGTDSINVPKVSTGTAVAVQSTQNSAVQNTDLTTTSISSTVTTVAGGQTVSLQLIEQSPLNIDDVVLSDLAADYARQLNLLVLSGSGTSGQPTGIMTLSGTNAIDYNPATVTAANFYSAVANAVQTIHTNRFLPPDTIIMHPRRWAWLVAQTDGQGRPLIVPHAGGPFNAMGNPGDVTSQGYVGTMQGLPVYVDALIPTNLTADTGTGEDAVIVARMADLMLWESHVRAEAFEQTYSQNMSVFIRLYNYMSFQAARYPKALSVITGKGLQAPTF